MVQGKKYFAFISYQRKDEEWADRLRSKLEHYRLPSSVRKQDASLPKEIRPIFRDALELAGGVLAKEIETALQQSKYLIVICSPNSAKSPWVNKEIQTFIDLGREDHIIPFIIDGTPFSDNEETECFPPALRSLKGEKELLGININELSRDAASIKVVARMFGLKFDTLWQRYEREKKKKRWMIIGSVALLAIVALVVAGFFMNMSRTISQQNTSLLKAAERMQVDSILQAQHIKRITEDSISLAQQNDSIQRQYTLIERQKDEIATERDNVKSANYVMQVNLSRILAKEASKLVDEGDSYLARLIALQALPPNLPYTMEAEHALRKAYYYNSSIIRNNSSHFFYSADFSPDGKQIVSASYGKVDVWDATTGERIGESIKAYNDIVNTVAFSPDGKYIAYACREDITICNSKTGKRAGHMLEHDSEVVYFTYSPNGKYILSASKDGTMSIWDSETRSLLCDSLNSDGVNYVAFSPDGCFFAAASYESIIIWDFKTRKQMGSLKGHTSSVESVSYSHDGKYLVSASCDKTIRIWDVKAMKQIGNPLKGHTDYVFSSKFSPYGYDIVSASKDWSIRIWENGAGNRKERLYKGIKVLSILLLLVQMAKEFSLCLKTTHCVYGMLIGHIAHISV